MPAPLACNLTVQGDAVAPVCTIIPPVTASAWDRGRFERNAPNLKSTNVNLWEAWHINWRPELPTGGFGEYDSADLGVARHMFDRLSSLGIGFYISDNTNGIGCDFGNTFAATLALAALSARYNAESGRTESTRMRYAVSVGVNPLGSPTDPAASTCTAWRGLKESSNLGTYVQVR